MTPLKSDIAVEELLDRNFEWDGKSWVSVRSGFHYGKGEDPYDSAVHALISVGFLWTEDQEEWVEPPVLNDDFNLPDFNIGMSSVLMVLAIIIAFLGVVIGAGVLSGVVNE